MLLTTLATIRLEVTIFLSNWVASLHQPCPSGSTQAMLASVAWKGRTEKQDSSLRVLLRVTSSTFPRSTKKTSTSPSEQSLTIALCHSLSVSDLITIKLPGAGRESMKCFLKLLL